MAIFFLSKGFSICARGAPPLSVRTMSHRTLGVVGGFPQALGVLRAPKPFVTGKKGSQFFHDVFIFSLGSDDVPSGFSRVLSMSGFWIPSSFSLTLAQDFSTKSGRLAGQALAPIRNHLPYLFVKLESLSPHVVRRRFFLLLAFVSFLSLTPAQASERNSGRLVRLWAARRLAEDVEEYGGIVERGPAKLIRDICMAAMRIRSKM